MSLGGQPIGGTLREARDAAGLSRERAARQLDPPVSYKTLERWENGFTPAPRWRLKQLAKVYGVSISTFNGRTA